MLSRSTAKKAYAMNIGAHKFISMGDANAVKEGAQSLDLILQTNHAVAQYSSLLDVDGTHVL